MFNLHLFLFNFYLKVLGAGITGWPNEYIWTGDRTTVNNDNWPTGYPHSEVNGVDLGTMVTPSNFTSYIWSPNYPSNYEVNYYQVQSGVCKEEKRVYSV